MRYIRKELQFLCRDLLDTLVRYREFLFLLLYQTISLIQQMILLAHFTININRVNSGTTQQKRQYQDNNQGTISRAIATNSHAVSRSGVDILPTGLIVNKGYRRWSYRS